MRAFIFPGQGSQAVGMGRALADASASARAVFQEVDEALGQHLFRVMTDGPVDELTLTGVRVQATRQIRALGVTTPIVGLSSDSLAADADAFIKAGADDFTPKVSHQLTACSVMHRLLSCTRDRWAEQQ